MDNHLWDKLIEEHLQSYKFISNAFIYELQLKLHLKIKDGMLYNKIIQIKELDNELDQLCQFIRGYSKYENWLITDIKSEGITLYILEVSITKIERECFKKVGKLRVKLVLPFLVEVYVKIYLFSFIPLTDHFLRLHDSFIRDLFYY